MSQIHKYFAVLETDLCKDSTSTFDCRFGDKTTQKVETLESLLASVAYYTLQVNTFKTCLIKTCLQILKYNDYLWSCCYHGYGILCH